MIPVHGPFVDAVLTVLVKVVTNCETIWFHILV